jgi:predicted permease
MLAAQIAMSVVLVTGALLLARSLYGLRTVDTGFRRDHVLVASTDVAKAIPRPPDQLRFEERLISRIGALPGVRSVSISILLPVVRGLWMADFTADGYVPNGKQDTACYLNFVSPRYFETMGTPILLGRPFAARDGQPGAPSVALVSESLARHFWHNENQVGKRIHELEKTDRATVIGVVRDAKYWTFRDGAPRTIYLPFPPPMSEGMARNYPIEIWTALRPEALIAAVRNVFENENSQVPVEFETFDELLDRQLLSERLLTIIALSFGGLGLLMAAIGIYGVAAYSVSRRFTEVGIRVALGATKAQIVWLFLNEHVMLVFSGVSFGVIGASILTRFLRTWLFGISAADLPSFAGSVALLAVVGVLATLIPAIRALKADPSRLLRSE